MATQGFQLPPPSQSFVFNNTMRQPQNQQTPSFVGFPSSTQNAGLFQPQQNTNSTASSLFQPAIANTSTVTSAPLFQPTGWGPSVTSTFQPNQTTPQSVTNTVTNTSNDKGQIIQCLNESKDIQLEILKELKIMNERNIISSQMITHNEVTCNGCMKQTIIGTRYKCLFCKDFDFCEDCEKNMPHDPNHSFIKIKDTVVFNNLMIHGSPLFNQV